MPKYNCGHHISMTDLKTIMSSNFKRPEISVIIVNLNGEKYLGDCLQSLAVQTFRDFEVVIVDNGSTDGSLTLVKNKFSWVRVIPLSKNTGFAKGNNTGFEASSAKYVATLNNDTIPDREWLKALYDAAELDNAIGMVASKIFLGKEGKELDSAGMLIYPDGMSRQRGHGQTDGGQFNKIEDVLFPSACAALYRREMLDLIGFFDEDFFSYCEDADLGLRARLAGWKANFAPGALVRHLYSQTGGIYSEFKAFHVERNHVMVLLKNMPLAYIMCSPLYTLWRYVIQVYGLLTGRGSVARFAEGHQKSALIKIIVRAYCSVLRDIPLLLRKRKAVWQGRHIGTKDYSNLLRLHRISAAELMLRD